MIARPWWITPQLAIVPRPRGGDWLEDEILALREAGIDIVISMLQEDEALELGLENEGVAAEANGLIFLNFPIRDRGTPPDLVVFEEFLKTVETKMTTGKRVGVHCRACIGRASVTATSLLIRSGMQPENAWQLVSSSRGCQLPDTIEQRQWVDQRIRRNS